MVCCPCPGFRPYKALKGPYKALLGPYKALKGPYKALVSDRASAGQ